MFSCLQVTKRQLWSWPAALCAGKTSDLKAYRYDLNLPNTSQHPLNYNKKHQFCNFEYFFLYSRIWGKLADWANPSYSSLPLLYSFPELSFCKLGQIGDISDRRSQARPPRKVASIGPHKSWKEAPEAAKFTSNQNGDFYLWQPQGPLIRVWGKLISEKNLFSRKSRVRLSLKKVIFMKTTLNMYYLQNISYRKHCPCSRCSRFLWISFLQASEYPNIQFSGAWGKTIHEKKSCDTVP